MRRGGVASLPTRRRRQQEQLSSGLKFKVIQSKFSELSMLSEQRGYSFDGGSGGGGTPCFRGLACLDGGGGGGGGGGSARQPCRGLSRVSQLARL